MLRIAPPRLASLGMLLALGLLPAIAPAADLGHGLTLDGEATFELRHTRFGTTAGLNFAPHLRWANPSDQFGLDLGAVLWRDGDGLTQTDLTYGSVFVTLGVGVLHLGIPKTAIEEVLRFPDFTTSTPENLLATTYSRSRVRFFDFELEGQLPGITWQNRLGNVEVAASLHRWIAPDTPGAMPSAQVALRYERDGTVLMAGAELAWASMPLLGTSYQWAYHLGALQDIGAWRVGALFNHLGDDTGLSSDLMRLHVDLDLTPELNLSLQYQRMDDFMLIEGLALGLRYDAPNKPLFLEAGIEHDDLSGTVWQTGLGLKF